MMTILKINRWPWFLVFLLAGGTVTVFAFVSINLFSQSMASVEFLRKFGREAILLGVFWQWLELVVWGLLSLSCWFLFKICEHELVDRYTAWTTK